MPYALGPLFEEDNPVEIYPIRLGAAGFESYTAYS